MEKIVSMSPLPAELINAFIQGRGITGIEVESVNGRSEEDIIEAVKGAHYIVGDFTFNHGITAAVADAAKKVRLIQQPSVGYQHIDIEACRSAGIRVANTAGANTIAVAEHTVMSALCLVKKIFTASYSTKRGEWKQLELKPAELYGKTWGLVGFGKTGKAVAQRLSPFGVKIVYYDLYRQEQDEEEKCGVSFMELPELLGASDIISLHCPLTEETRGLIGRETISLMRETAFLVNVSRGEVIDEGALVEALKAGRIGGASLDVFAEEPVDAQSPLITGELDNLILSPHVAGVSVESQLRIMGMTVDNLERAIKGEPVINLVT